MTAALLYPTLLDRMSGYWSTLGQHTARRLPGSGARDHSLDLSDSVIWTQHSGHRCLQTLTSGSLTRLTGSGDTAFSLGSDGDFTFSAFINFSSITATNQRPWQKRGTNFEWGLSGLSSNRQAAAIGNTAGGSYLVASTPTLSLDTWHHFIAEFIRSEIRLNLYLNSTSILVTQTTTSGFLQGPSSDPIGSERWHGRFGAAGVWRRRLSAEEKSILLADPHAPFRLLRRRRVALPIAVAGTTGDLQATQQSHSLSATATLPLIGSASPAQQAHSLLAAGQLATAASLLTTQDDQQLTATGTTLLGATLSQTQDDQQLTAAGEAAIAGSLLVLQADHTLTASSTLGATLSQTQDDQQLTAAGEAAIAGSLLVLQADHTLTAGTVNRIGNLTATQDDQQLTATLTVRLPAPIVSVDRPGTQTLNRPFAPLTIDR